MILETKHVIVDMSEKYVICSADVTVRVKDASTRHTSDHRVYQHIKLLKPSGYCVYD